MNAKNIKKNLKSKKDTAIRDNQLDKIIRMAKAGSEGHQQELLHIFRQTHGPIRTKAHKALLEMAIKSHNEKE